MFMANGFPSHRPVRVSRIGITIFALTAGFTMGAYATEPSIAAGQPGIGGAETSPGLSLCATEETVVFSCRTVGKKAKLLSLCGSKVLDEKTGYIQYRFGQPGNVELEFPKEKQIPNRHSVTAVTPDLWQPTSNSSFHWADTSIRYGKTTTRRKLHR